MSDTPNGGPASAAQPAPELTGWQPIETAPKMEHIILCLPDRYIGVGYYDDDDGEMPGIGWVMFGSGLCEPTHWMPLPQPPGSQAAPAAQPSHPEARST